MAATDGWERVRDASGRVFYVNYSTRETAWQLPTNNPLPPGWQEMGGTDGPVYFVNHNTHETTWIDPRLATNARGSRNTGGGRHHRSVDDRSPGVSYNGLGRIESSPTPTSIDDRELDMSGMTIGLPGGYRDPDEEEDFDDVPAAESTPPEPLPVAVSTPDIALPSPSSSSPSVTAAVAAGGSSPAGDTFQPIRHYYAPLLLSDITTSSCMHCNSKFNALIRRRHHCRLCGYIYCAECTSKKIILPIVGQGYDQRVSVCARCDRNIQANDFFSIVALRHLIADNSTRVTDKREQLAQLTMVLKVGREETGRSMGHHRIAQLNDVDAAGGIGSFCKLLNTDSEELQKGTLDMLSNLMALEIGAGNEVPAGEAFAQSGACSVLVKLMGSKVLEQQHGGTLRPEVERKALRLFFHISRSVACQNALRAAGGGARLRELLSTESSVAIDVRVEAARCLKKYVVDNSENIAELAKNDGITLLCALLGEFVSLRATSLSGLNNGGNSGSPEESFEVAVESILSTLCECLHYNLDTSGSARIPPDSILSFVDILRSDDHRSRMLSFQVLIQASQEPSMVMPLLETEEFMTEMISLLDDEDNCSIASQILLGLTSSVAGSEGEEAAQDIVLQKLYDYSILELAVTKLKGCIIGPNQFTGEVNFQKSLLGIVKYFTERTATYGDQICVWETVPALSAFMMSKKTSLVPYCAQALMNLCDFKPALFDDLVDSNASDFFQRLLQTPPDENRYSALRYFRTVVESNRVISCGVLDTLFVLASGRDGELKERSLKLLADVTGIHSVEAISEPLPDVEDPDRKQLMERFRERVASPACFPVLMTLLSSDSNIESRVDALKCLRVSIEDGIELTIKMIDQGLLRGFCNCLRKWTETDGEDESLALISPAVLHLLYLVLNSTVSHIADMVGDHVRSVVTAVTDFLVANRDRMRIGMCIIRVVMGHQFWKDCFLAEYADDSSTSGLQFIKGFVVTLSEMSESKVESDALVCDDCFFILEELVKEVSNSSVVNMIISAGVHVSLFELLTSHREESSGTIVRTLEVLDTITQTRRIRLLVLEAGMSLNTLVELYESTTANFSNLDEAHQNLARLTGRIIVNLSSDPLEFRKTLYDHRAVLPTAIIENVLSDVDEVSQVAEEIVANLVESDFATCPLWVDMVENTNISRLFSVIVVARRSSVRVTVARKLTEIVYSNPERLEESLSPAERSTLVSKLIDFLVDSDPRTSVVGILALALLLKNNQTFNDEQMERISVEGAVSIVYWMQKGTERHQDNAANILHDGVTNLDIRKMFYAQLKEESIQRDIPFLTVMGQQIVDIKISSNSVGVFKRCTLLTEFLETVFAADLPEDAKDLIVEVTEYLLGLIKGSQRPELEYFPHIFRFLKMEAESSEGLSVRMVKRGGIEAIVALLKELREDESELAQSVSEDAKDLLKRLYTHDLPRIVSSNGVSTLISIMIVENPTLGETQQLVSLFDAILQCGVAGQNALMTSSEFVSSIERALDDVVKSGFSGATESGDEWHTPEKLDLACQTCVLLFELAKMHSAREPIFHNSQLLTPILLILECFSKMYDTLEDDGTLIEPTVDMVMSFRSVLGAGIPFLECAMISVEEGIVSTTERMEITNRMFQVVVRVFQSFERHDSVELLVLACEGITTFIQNDDFMESLSVETLYHVRELLKTECEAALTSSTYTMDAVMAMIDVAYVLFTAVMTGAKVQWIDVPWLIDVVLYVIVSTSDNDQPVDLTNVMLLLARVCGNFKSRSYVRAHSSYSALPEALAQVAIQSPHTTVTKVLTLLGEEDPSPPRRSASIAAQSTGRTGRAMSAVLGVDISKSLPANDGENEDYSIRCFKCTKPITVPSGQGIRNVSCEACGRAVTTPSTDVRRSSFVILEETADEKNDDEVEADEKPTRVSSIHSSTRASDENDDEDGEASAPPSGPVGPAPGSSANVDVKDTKVVSCGHCSKHLIVKSSATAVKCPTCHGVSKLSTKTTQEVMRCQNCSTLLSLPAGAKAYKCMKCLHTTRLS